MTTFSVTHRDGTEMTIMFWTKRLHFALLPLVPATEDAESAMVAMLRLLALESEDAWQEGDSGPRTVHYSTRTKTYGEIWFMRPSIDSAFTAMLPDDH